MISPYVCQRTEYEPDHFATLDIENDAQQHGKLIAMVLAWRDAQGGICLERFYSWNTFLAYLTKHTTQKAFRKIYAHNGSGFDWLNMLTDWIQDKALLQSVKILRDGQGKAICFVIKLPGRRGSIRLLDSLRLMPESLERLTHDFGVGEKVKEDVDEKRMGELFVNNPSLFWKRVETDTVYLLKVIEAFGKYVWDYVLHYDELPITIGSLALLAFRAQLKDPIYVNWSPEQKGFIRRSYTGGSVNTYKRGLFDAAAVDVNSEYPSVMYQFTYPCSNRCVWSKQYHDGGLYEIVYEQTNHLLPPYLRDEPSREFRYKGQGVFWSWDLSNLETIGGRYKIIRGLVFLDWKPIFKDIIDKLYRLRLEFKDRGDAGGEKTIKLIMNSMYGKFGQRPVGRETVFMSDAEALGEVKKGKRLTRQQEGVYLLEKDIEVKHEFVAVASAVTSRGRELLYKFKQIAGQELISEDTDSVKFQLAALPRFTPYLDQRKLGFVKLEWVGQIAVIQNKLYAYRANDGKEKVVSKGVPPKALTFDIIKRIALDEIPHYQAVYESPATLSEVLEGQQGGEFLERHRTISKSKPLSQFG